MNIKKSLIICTSVLQMIIAEKIIDLHPGNEFDLVVVAINDSKKYRYYFNRLRNKCNKSLFYSLAQGKGAKRYFQFKSLLRKQRLNRPYTQVYLASFDNLWVQIIISKQRATKIYTFDDGLANIIRNSHYYTLNKPSQSTRIKKWLIGARLSSEKIKNSSLKHYTIYKDIPNIIENTQYISVFNSDNILENCNKESSKSISFFIGQPLGAYGNIFNRNYIQGILKKFNITLYYPHPKESKLPQGLFEVIESELVFEEYLLKYLHKNPDITVHIYSFFSSCLPNIAHIDGVKLTFIHNDILWNRLKDFYESCHEKFGINHIHVN